jgi:hypothetical protein
MMKRLRNVCFAAVVVLLFFSCATKPEVYQAVDSEVAQADFDTALRTIEAAQTPPEGKNKPKKPIYPEKSTIMFYLDKGALEHYAGRFEDSSQTLQEGERLIEEAFTKDVSQEVSSYIANDNTRDYSGEDYEDIYINVFNSLNYYHRGDLEGALVEVRRVNEKLTYLTDKYEAGGSKIKTFVQNRVNNLIFPQEPVTFSNSALARYLGGLFYRGNKNMDDARIDLEEVRNAYTQSPGVYNNPLPKSLDEELEIPQGKARLNVLAFAGLSPVKEQWVQYFPLPLEPPNNTAKLALPRMIDRPSLVTRVEVAIDGGETLQLELLEDMGLVAFETFKAKFSLIFLKTVTRVIVKATASAAASKAAEQSGGMGALVGLVGKVATDVSEQADIRMSRYFPRYALVGGLNLDPGTYNLTVNYYANDGLIWASKFEGVQVDAGKLNLVEAVCLR